jgi:hypothetical protein
VRIERVDLWDADALSLLREHARDMASRYPGQEWGGVEGDRDALWLARHSAGGAVGCVALRDLGDGNVEVKHLYREGHVLGVSRPPPPRAEPHRRVR